MAQIVKLDAFLSNKIAAGEVVERPASIVKELLENALDASSTNILIEVEEGGLSSIRILDNGDGIEAEDVETAFYRHATSKIKTDRDLFKIRTLGFRGEALPSIASVSHLTMRTCTGEGAGVELTLEGGHIQSRQASKTRKGTEVIVKNLFYNTPARLKYLKTVHTEAGHISDVVNRLALAHPHVSMSLYHNGKEVLKTSGNKDLRQVIASIYGRNVAKEMVEVHGRSLDYTVSGYVAKPEVTRASRQYMSLFINGRYIRNFHLARAVQEGFHTLLPIGRFPVVVIRIEMDPTLIDVNVHPSKLEVRLSKEEELSSLITTSIQSAFKQETLIPEVRHKKPEMEPIQEQLPFDTDTTSSNRSELEPKQERMLAREHTISEDSPSEKKEAKPVNDGKHSSEATDVQSLDQVESPQVEEVPAESDPLQVGETVKMNSPRVPVMYPVGQMHGTYIVAQNEDGMYLIDQHAAQERIKYEYYREKVAQYTRETQELLIPMTIECTNQEAIIIDQHIDDLRQVGVFLEDFGTRTYIVRSHPTWLPKGLEEETIREIIDHLFTSSKIDIKRLREEAAILMSCKASIKANRHLRQDEMFALLESLRKSSDPFTCPHGRPIIVHFSSYELEKMFKRVM
ncbi:DNA mismatch repair endonuclease MutL [Alkalihalophilus lindianensis]|uniref:DNA mismatch repair protein MutL n=1 Tax=Alkalihalophilus lindianensis TaxID=1630542 RepID=A0ABU3XDK2_9BACI|nr:DNA mismatch repair endonuclease MutL [Alkalihalophilus lindianensis]MDV2685514.1 DNA mismatch repair endonuclease MutL [Alkalihalophilus lindianensis]